MNSDVLMVDTRSNARGMFHLVDDILGLIVGGWGDQVCTNLC